MFKNNKVKGFLVASLLLGLIVSGLTTNSANAQTTTTVEQLQALINQLTAQMQTLQQQLAQVKTQQQQITQTVSQIVSALKQGDAGENVRTLQALLAADQSIYPEGLITGFYGPLTTKAIKKFQEKHGLESVGFVGPKTRIKLNELLEKYPLAYESESTSTVANATSNSNVIAINDKNKRDDDDEDDDDRAKRDDDDEDEDDDDDRKFESRRICAIVPPGHLIAPGWLKKHYDDDDNNVIIPICQILPYGIIKKLSPSATSTPDIVAPVISNVSALNITATSSKIHWNTNELATSKVYFGTSFPVDINTAANISDNSFVTDHNINLTSLSASTTYYYVVQSSDQSGNTASSSAQTHQFTTLSLPVADTIAPTISGISASNIASSTATVSWTTNEPATSKVYFSLAPINLTTASSVSDNSLLTSHALNLSSLTASSTYEFVAESKDASNNTATSTAQSFTTTQ
ncbi:MAG: peptidoglycan-binding protein [Patescibacteria group bacterium]